MLQLNLHFGSALSSVNIGDTWIDACFRGLTDPQPGFNHWYFIALTRWRSSDLGYSLGQQSLLLHALIGRRSLSYGHIRDQTRSLITFETDLRMAFGSGILLWCPYQTPWSPSSPYSHSDQTLKGVGHVVRLMVAKLADAWLRMCILTSPRIRQLYY